MTSLRKMIWDQRPTAASIPDAVLVLACLLPFLVPLSLSWAIDLQGIVMILAGLLAWIPPLLQSRKRWVQHRYVYLLLALYLACCVASLLAHPNFANVFGSKLVRIGVPALVGSVGIGLTLRSIETRRLIKWLYGECLLLAITALFYVPQALTNAWRLGGVFHQADFLAVFMAAGLILGIGVWHESPRYRKVTLLAQLLMVGVLFLTGTRAVLALTVVITGIMLLRSSIPLRRKVIVVSLSVVVILVATVVTQGLLAHRFTDRSLVSESATYRFSLQHFGFQAALHEPLFGYGPGNLMTPLACPSLHDPALQQTCHQGYYFDSSHNVYLDRVLALGWGGGLAFAVFVAIALYKGLRSTGVERYFAYIALLIAAYYFTNPTDLEIELLFWVVLLRPFRKLRGDGKQPPLLTTSEILLMLRARFNNRKNKT